MVWFRCNGMWSTAGIVEYGGAFVRTVHLTEDQWIKCILLGALSLPLGIRLMILIELVSYLMLFQAV